MRKKKDVKATPIHYIQDGMYICNRAVIPTPSKSTYDIQQVTCKNCKNQLRIKHA